MPNSNSRLAKMGRVFGLLVFGLMALGASTTTWGQPAEPKMVFAHYMVAFPTYGTSVAAFSREVREAQALGIDGFVLNVGAWSSDTPEFRERVANMFTAAEQVGRFSLFLSADMCCALSDEDIVSLIETFGARNCYFRPNGRPVLTTFLGQAKGELFWQIVRARLKRENIDILFVPFFLPEAECDYRDPLCSRYSTPSLKSIQEELESWWIRVVDGLNYFAVSGTVDDVIRTAEAYATVTTAKGKVFLAGVYPYYWLSRLPATSDAPFRRFFDGQGGEGIEKQWMSIIQVQKPKWVVINTYNDFTESYISPAQPAEIPLKQYFFNAAPLMEDHRGYAELFSYYISWFKSGSPPYGGPDKLFVFYRTHTKDAVALNDVPNIRVYGDVSDSIYITTITKTGGTVYVNSGSSEAKRVVGGGIQHFRVPSQTGLQSFRLEVQGRDVVFSGPPISRSITKYNFNSVALTGTIK